MTWGGNLDRLATRVNLRKRNVDISSVMCPFYDEYEGTVNHLFTACSVAIRVWAAISAWCNIPPIYAFKFKDLMDFHNSIQGGYEEDDPRVGYQFMLVYLKKRKRVGF
ncbi:putative reverse transcriptase zinc-binding domain-containing protein [Helianthus anomalus]